MREATGMPEEASMRLWLMAADPAIRYRALRDPEPLALRPLQPAPAV
ncbi:MAG: hypothetical protein JWM50_1744 [Microbacteriaceae bacterium]|jgi:hypothetical protein|nr:hypothetical protein [Microbacteriaceae bacterium]